MSPVGVPTNAAARSDAADEALPAAVPDVRTLRRSRGLSQVNFADLMGVSQPTVSRWERGTEAISFAQRMRMLDIFLNKRGELNPLLEAAVRFAPNITILQHSELTVLAIADRHWTLKEKKESAADAIGRNLERSFLTNWRRELSIQNGADHLLVEAEYDLIGKGSLKGYRSRRSVKATRLNFEGFERPISVTFSEPRHAAFGCPPVLRRSVTIADLDCRP